MNGTQRKHLRDRAMTAYHAKRRRINSLEIDEPAEVQAAKAEIAKLEKIVDRWMAKLHRTQDAARAKLSAEYERVQEALLFSDAQKALAAVKKFEATLK